MASRLPRRLFLVLNLVIASSAWAALPVGKKPSRLDLSGERGGLMDGGSWSSDQIAGKIHVLFYVDPDEKDLNEPTAEALKAEKFPYEKFSSIAIINMAATWIPNFALKSSLKDKQAKYPRTTYVRDQGKFGVKEWGLGDDTSSVSLFDMVGNVLFSKDGKLSDADNSELIALIRKNLLLEPEARK